MRVHSGVEFLILRFAEGLGTIHRRIRVTQNVFRLLVVVVGILGAYARRYKQLPAGEMERLGEHSLPPLRNSLRIAIILDPVQEDRKLVAPQPSDRVALTE